MRSKKAIINISVSMVLQSVVIICGLITPRLIITSFGSGYNGITSSVTQFLSIVALLRAGVGGVTRAALYKPLADGDMEQISSIIRATEKFMRTIAMVFCVYVVVLACVYPFLVNQSEYGGWFSVSSYIIILSIETIAQYYFAITYQLLLTADQREYVYNGLQILQTVINTVIIVVFINAGASIHIVKLVSAAAYMINPIFLHYYVQKRYELNKKAKPNETALSQRWDALAHNIADFIHGNTDLILLTLLAGDISVVSVYSVYYLVINGIKKVVTICTTGLEAAFGNMMAKQEYDTAKRILRLYEFFIYCIATILFSCVIVLVVPFVHVYTEGVTDANYYQPVFALIATLAEAVYCIRIPYSSIVYACGHYKQTRNGAMAEAGINLAVSTVCVLLFRMAGFSQEAIIGVAIGTLTANTFRTFQFMRYLSNRLLKRPLREALQRFVMMISAMFIFTLLFRWVGYGEKVEDFFQWTVYAVCSGTAISIITVVGWSTVYRSDMRMCIQYLRSITLRRRNEKK